MSTPPPAGADLFLAALLLGVPAFLPGFQGHPPGQAAARMTVPEGFRVELVAAEPAIRQPVAIDFDERGRLWVMQYLQYPNPAGLERVAVDRYSRTTYDRIPEPPPRGPRGADRLTIVEPDPVRKGAVRTRDFVSGLNLASAFAFGHGGVYVLQAPYLLFYPDRDRDDRPDGDPEVLLTGFGMEDAHSVANSLTWGPDGWLYGCQGSTVTARIRGIEFQQGVWRYHPIRREFELFCEGGGNSWGLDFDRHGQLLYSTNHGGYVMLHGVQGGYFWKSFGKHGALHHPHAYGYFDHVPHSGFTGGHVTVGGIIYQGNNFPPEFRNRYIAADLLGHAVRWHEVEADGSSFRSRQGGELLRANDTWFAPSDVCLGPDGCVYVADWHDARTAHPDPDATWDRENGRVFRLAHGRTDAVGSFDLAGLSSRELVALLTHANDWHRRSARRILADRRDPEVILPLRTMVMEARDPDLALQALWALQVSGGLTEEFGRRLLGHPDPHLRRWAVRLLGDERRLEERATAEELKRLARTEPRSVVRSQLASTARRLPAGQALPILEQLLRHDEDLHDPHIPLLLWWGLERFALDERGLLVRLFTQTEAGASLLSRRALVPRLVRRYAAAARPEADAACGQLLQAASENEDRQRLLEGMEAGLGERGLGAAVSAELAALVLKMADGDELTFSRLRARLGGRREQRELLGRAAIKDTTLKDRVALVEAFGNLGLAADAEELLPFILSAEPEPLRLAALAAWQKRGSREQVSRLLDAYASFPAAVRARTRSVLLSRKPWARALLEAVDAGRIPAMEFGLEELQTVAAHGEAELDLLVRKHWGTHRGPTPEEKLAEVRRLQNDLRAARGDPVQGKQLFARHCGVCHRLFGEGGSVGPDLTHANRGDRDFLLVSLVDPSGMIRKEYATHVLAMEDGRVLTGLIAESTPMAVTLVNAQGERTTVRRAEIVALRETPVSLMPDNLAALIKPQELRDLFGYLQGSPPEPAANSRKGPP